MYVPCRPTCNKPKSTYSEDPGLNSKKNNIGQNNNTAILKMIY